MKFSSKFNAPSLGFSKISPYVVRLWFTCLLNKKLTVRNSTLRSLDSYDTQAPVAVK